MTSFKIAVFGCKANTKFLIEELERFTRVDFLVTIPEELAERNKVADFMDLASWAKDRGIHVYTARHYGLLDSGDLDAIRVMGIDLAFVNGWQRLLPQPVLESIAIGAFGMHGSAMDLPRGRGRSPMNWSILEGRRQFYTNLFQYDSGVDSGGILDTFKFQILDSDTSETLHYKNSLAMVALIRRNWNDLQTRKFSLSPQREDVAPTYYPKRSARDGQIDFGDDIVGIEKLIRAVAPPFGGAYAYIDGEYKVVFERASLFDTSDFYFEKAEAGTIVMVWPSGKFLVKCLGGLLLVHEYRSPLDLSDGLRFSPSASDPVVYFPRNRFGHFDLEEEG